LRLALDLSVLKRVFLFIAMVGDLLVCLKLLVLTFLLLGLFFVKLLVLDA